MINELVYPGGVVLVLLLGGSTAFWRLSSRFRTQELKSREQQEKLEKTNRDLESRLTKTVLPTDNHPEVVSLQGKVHHLEKDLAVAKQNITTKDEENSRLTHQLSQLEQQVVNLRSQFSQLEKFHEQLKIDHQKQLQDLLKGKESLSLNLQTEVSLVADLRSQILSLEKAQKNQDNALLKLQELEQAQQLWHVEKFNLEKDWRSQLEGLELALSQEKVINQDLNQQLIQGQQRAKEYQTQAEQANAAVTEIQNRLQQLEQEQSSNAHFKSEWEKLNIANQELETKYQAQLIELKSLQNLEVTLQQQVQKQAEVLHQAQQKVLVLEKQLTEIPDLSPQLKQQQEKITSLEQELNQSKTVASQLELERSKVLGLEKQLAESQIQAEALELERSKVLGLEKQLAERIQESVIAESVKPIAETIKPIPETIETIQASPTPEIIAPPVAVVETLAEKVEITLAPQQAPAQKVKTAKAKEKVPAVIKSPDIIPEVKSEAIALNDTVEPETVISQPEEVITSMVESAVETAIAQETEEKVITENPSSPGETVNVIETEIKNETEVAAVQSSAPNANLEGKNWIILGTLNLINRDRAKELIQASGGRVTSSPSGKTDYAIVGKASGDKLKKAQKLGITQLSESQFLKLLGVEA